MTKKDKNFLYRSLVVGKRKLYLKIWTFFVIVLDGKSENELHKYIKIGQLKLPQLQNKYYNSLRA